MATSPLSLDRSAGSAENLEKVRSLAPKTFVSEDSSARSEREKVEEFALRRSIEKLRVFYAVLQIAMTCLKVGVLLTFLTEILWRLIPGPVAEGVICIIGSLAWLLTSATVVFTSLCPQDELDIDIFVAARPGLTIRFALLPLTTGGMRALEFPFPRWISIAVGLAWLFQGCTSCRCCSASVPQSVRRCLGELSFVTIFELWYMDVVVAGAVNEAALDEPGIWTSVWLVFHAAVVVILHLLLRRRLRNTMRFYVASYLTLSWITSYFACRAIDLSLGHKEWEEGRSEDIAIMAAIGYAALIFSPMLVAMLIGQQRLFHRLAVWLDHSRGRRLQDGAFMAMLLDQYVVELGQLWWLTNQEIQEAAAAHPEQVQKKARAASGPPDHEPRPGFMVGVVVAAAEDSPSFSVEYQLDEHTVQVVQVNRGHEFLPWPALLQMGRKNLRCVDWAALSPAVLKGSGGGNMSDFALSRSVRRGEIIDFFVSHSWSDSPARKWKAFQLVAEDFYEKNGRYPTFWIDKFCINQKQIADGLRVLPVNVMSCRKMLCLSGKTYHARLWCAWELCVLLSFMSMQMALKQIVVVPLVESALVALTAFDSSKARCYDPNEEHRLRRVIEAIGQQRFEIKIRALGQLLLDRHVNGDSLFMPTGSGLELEPESEVETRQSGTDGLTGSTRPTGPERPTPPTVEVDDEPMIEVPF
ncbi:unnamed protein product [Symbiodinium natans]|uniref:Heterokaryon incompatibility domain-containing protein n=1 Tax=Symbiodinium natans TaxID=878477 RepID=A0A812KGY4_9DINO|nr:unnamed protein product [Symbiodinium natans]